MIALGGYIGTPYPLMSLSCLPAAALQRDSRRGQILTEQIRLLYSNTNLGAGIPLIAAAILCSLQWEVVPHPVILGWCLYMFLVSVGRFTLGRRYWLSAPSTLKAGRWGTGFAIGAGLAGAGWGAAAILLYQEAHLLNQVLLIFFLGGMMLGAVSFLAPLPAAYIAFIVPTGLAPAVRLAVQGDEAHLAMGLMASLFTLATLITARRIHLTIVSSLNLRFEYQRAESTLSESEERFRNMADTAPVMIWVTGPDKLCTFFNKAWLEFTGRTMEQELGNGWVAGVHPDDVDRCIATYTESFDARRSFRMECRMRRADGEYRWVLDSAVPRLAPDDVFAGYVGSSIDITEVKRTQEDTFARQKLESVGTLAAGVAHDFNNLLGTVLAQAELAQAELADGSDPQEELERIRYVSIRGSEIVRQLMIYAGKERDDPSGPVDVSRIVREMHELLKVSVSKHVVLEMDLGINLPAVQASPAQLRQVVMNLITNASEAIGDRKGLIRVTTRPVTVGRDSIGTISEGLADGDYLQMEVSDTGSGILTETRSKIFDPFFSTKSVGRGLGLAVVQGIVRGLRGEIRLDSQPHIGTTFQILLPCIKTAAATLWDDTAHEESAALSRAVTILVVEDEDPLREAVVKILRRKGFSVIEASDGSSALEAIQMLKNPIDVLFLDLNLPGAPCRQVFEEAKQVRPEMKLIVTSAYSEDMAAASLQGKVEHFLRKPYQLRELVDLLRQVLR